MRFRIFDFGFSILVWLGLSATYEAVVSKIFPNAMKTTTIEQQSSSHDFASKLFENSSNVLDNIELDDLGSIINEFAQGLPSDTEFSVM
ncbi:hypothetical protein [Scytonema sp. NUACC26]|uniref:hypothetical protein n=1 Tax=Scytonema sp. NUACC26 TaxID=3140176 RepID=UPI0034DC5652